MLKRLAVMAAAAILSLGSGLATAQAHTAGHADHSTTATVAADGLLTTPASHATPLAATGCAGRICMHVTTPALNGSFTISGWTKTSGDCFFGHYEVLYTPNGFHYNSATKTWCHTNNFSHGFNTSTGTGQWCLIGWSDVNGHLNNIGEPCENVS